MRISVKVKPNSKDEKVEKLGANDFVARVKAPAQGGKANAALVKLMSEYFDIPKRAIIISKGLRGRGKVIDVLETF